MKQLTLQYTIEVIEHFEELIPEEQSLVQACKEASLTAYAPYSQFYVGAAILLKDGITIIKGSNQENAAYPSGLCAERVAYFAAGALDKGKEIAKIAVTAHTKAFDYPHVVSPCGACRQVMAEYEQLAQQPTVVLLTGMKTTPIYRIVGIQTLLPLSFVLNPSL